MKTKPTNAELAVTLITLSLEDGIHRDDKNSLRQAAARLERAENPPESGFPDVGLTDTCKVRITFYPEPDGSNYGVTLNWEKAAALHRRLSEELHNIQQ